MKKELGSPLNSVATRNWVVGLAPSLPSFLRLRKGSFDFVDGVDRQKGRRNLLFWCTKSTADHLQNYTTHKKKEKKKQEEEGTTTSSLSSSSSSSSSLIFFSYILKLHKEEELQELKLHQQLQALWAPLVLCRFVRGDGFWSCKCCCCCCTWVQNKASKVTLCLLLLLEPKKHLLLCIIIIILVQNHNSLTRILFVCGDACLHPQTYWFLLCRIFWLFLLCPRVLSVVEWFFAWKLSSDVSSQIGWNWKQPTHPHDEGIPILLPHLYLQFLNITYIFATFHCSLLVLVLPWALHRSEVIA